MLKSNKMTTKIKTLILIFSLFLLIGTSCKKDSNGNPIIPGINTSMDAKIDGIIWNSITRVTNKNGNTINMVGTSLDGKIIQLNITPAVVSESLTINKDYTLTGNAFYKKDASASANDIYGAISGTVRLSALDLTNKLISGTFSFTAVSISFGTANITAGTFSNITYVGN